MGIINMIVISDAELQQTFGREFPKDLDHVTNAKEILPYDFDSLVVTEKFMGQKWENIHADVLRECFDVNSTLNPRAFQYFFPAFIKQSQVDIEKTSVLVESLIRMLADGGVHWPESMKDAEAKLLKENPEIAEALDSIDEKDLSAWRQGRWKLFTEQQWAIVRKWLNWIDQDKRWEVDRDVLQQAIKNADDWRLNSTRQL
ncbi:MAG: hypothetical protein HY273_02630 [Gammaproteobacteria bacterium]|nr:hypothetical protein [Gammaproteobacteria bacterium]